MKTFQKIRLVALLLLTALAAWATRSDPASTGYEFIPDMAHSVPYDAYAPNPVTRDGKTLQPPVAGTIARGGPLPFHYAATAEDAVRAGRELRNPFPPSPAVLARGQTVYQTFCAVCHGLRGAGDGPLIPKFPNPPSYTSARLLAMPDGQIFHVITRGSGMMPSYAGQIAPEDRWRAVAWVRALQAGALRGPVEVARK
ncbi:MAG: cytochrome c [Acidobacteria bacterium]|jgi:mono/diheme cytochrome c family protein|nr:cytochrome c [Acidobacteriota bacterium]